MSKFNERRSALVLQALSRMSSKASAAEAAGVSYSTYQYWYNNFPEFKKKVDDVLEDVGQRGKTIAIQAIFNKMDTQWQAAAWWLERNFPDEYGRVDRMKMDVTDKKMIFTIGNNDATQFIEKPGTNFLDVEKVKKIVAKGKKNNKEKIEIDIEEANIEKEVFDEIEIDPRPIPEEANRYDIEFDGKYMKG